MLAEAVPGGGGGTRIESEGCDRERVVDRAVRGARILVEISKAVIEIDEGDRKRGQRTPQIWL